MVARGPFEGRERQKQAGFKQSQTLVIIQAHAAESVVYRSPFSVDTLYRILVAAQTNHYGPHSLLPLVLKSSTMGC